MASPEFVVHKASLDQNEQSYLIGTNPAVTNGFQPNTYAYAYAVNAILHESSLITTALANMINASSTVITPNDDVNDVKTAFTNYLNAFVIPEATHAASADATTGKLYIYQNGSQYADEFNGSSDLTMNIYAPSSIAANNQILFVKNNAIDYSDFCVSSRYLDSSVNRQFIDFYFENTSFSDWIYFHNATRNLDINVKISGDTELDKTLTLIRNNAASTDTAFDIFDNVQAHGSRFSITYGGDVTSDATIKAVSFIATSDIRKKDNITDYAPSKSILDLPVKQFDFKSNGSHHIGCIAQDLQKIAPELVHEDDEGYLTIEESKLVYLLLDEVKKLRKELDELKGSK